MEWNPGPLGTREDDVKYAPAEGRRVVEPVVAHQNAADRRGTPAVVGAHDVVDRDDDHGAREPSGRTADDRLCAYCLRISGRVRARRAPSGGRRLSGTLDGRPLWGGEDDHDLRAS